LQLSAGEVEHEVAVGRAALRERLPRCPRLPGARRRIDRLERLAADQRQHRRMGQPESLARRAVALSELLAELAKRVGGGPARRAWAQSTVTTIRRRASDLSNPRYSASPGAGGIPNGSWSAPFGRAMPPATPTSLMLPPRSTR